MAIRPTQAPMSNNHMYSKSQPRDITLHSPCRYQRHRSGAGDTHWGVSCGVGCGLGEGVAAGEGAGGQEGGVPGWKRGPSGVVGTLTWQ